MKGQRDLFKIGEKYGSLTITKRWTAKSPSHKSKETFCEFKCDCGTEGIVLRACYLNDKRRKFSCGCLTNRRGQRNLYKPGERFGKLVILKKWTQYKNNHKSKESICECKCDCGNIVTSKSKNLRHKQSCGCSLYRINKDHPAWRGYEKISGSKWSSILNLKYRRNRILPFNLTKEELWELFVKQDGKCALSGVEIQFAERDRRYGGICTASLDRIDSSKGYTIDNVQWLHKDVNLMKMSLEQDKFLDWCKIIGKYNNDCQDVVLKI